MGVSTQSTWGFAIIPHQSKNTILSKTNPKHTFRTQPIQTFSNTNHTTLHLTSTMSGYDSYYSQGYQNQNQYSSYNQPATSSYPSDGFSGSQSYQTQQPYYQDNRAPYAQVVFPLFFPSRRWVRSDEKSISPSPIRSSSPVSSGAYVDKVFCLTECREGSERASCGDLKIVRYHCCDFVS